MIYTANLRSITEELNQEYLVYSISKVPKEKYIFKQYLKDLAPSYQLNLSYIRDEISTEIYFKEYSNELRSNNENSDIIVLLNLGAVTLNKDIIIVSLETHPGIRKILGDYISEVLGTEVKELVI